MAVLQAGRKLDALAKASARSSTTAMPGGGPLSGLAAAPDESSSQESPAATGGTTARCGGEGDRSGGDRSRKDLNGSGGGTKEGQDTVTESGTGQDNGDGEGGSGGNGNPIPATGRSVTVFKNSAPREIGGFNFTTINNLKAFIHGVSQVVVEGGVGSKLMSLSAPSPPLPTSNGGPLSSVSAQVRASCHASRVCGFLVSCWPVSMSFTFCPGMLAYVHLHMQAVIYDIKLMNNCV